MVIEIITKQNKEGNFITDRQTKRYNAIKRQMKDIRTNRQTDRQTERLDEIHLSTNAVKQPGWSI